MRENKKEKQFAFWCLLGMTLLAAFPYWMDYLFLGEDTLAYLHMLVPTFLIANGCSLMTTYKLIVLLLIAVSTWSIYSTLKYLFDARQVALIGTLAYQLSPWCIRVLYQKGALGTYVMIAFLPLLYRGIFILIRAFRRNSKNSAPAILFLAAGIVGLLASYRWNAGIRYTNAVQFGINLAGAALLFGYAVCLSWFYEGFCMKKPDDADRRIGIAFVMAVILLLPAIFLLNQVVFEADVYYIHTVDELYEAEVRVEELARAVKPVEALPQTSVGRILLMILIQVGTAATSYLWLRDVFPDSEDARETGFYGMLLYLSLPCRVQVCCDWMDLAKAILWMLTPLGLWGVRSMTSKVRHRHETGKGRVSACFALLVTMIGFVILVPHIGARKEVTLGSIMDKGYSIGGLFSSFVYRNDRPGMGLALMLGLLTGVWLLFVKGIKPSEEVRKKCRNYLIAGILFTVMSLRYFPWDYAQRLGHWALWLVSSLETPAVFFTVAQIAFCVPAAEAIVRLKRQEDIQFARGVRVLIILAAVGYCAFRIYIR